MRFYSFFQSEQYFDGEVWMNKLLMLETNKYTVTDGANYIRSEESMALPVEGVSDKEQLRKLKATHGSWALAPLLVTPASFWQKNAIAVLAKPCWSNHAWMSQHILTPEQSARYTIAKSQGGWKDEILELVLQGFCSTSALKKLYPFQSTSEATKAVRLSIHYDFVVHLMGKRASSLCSFYCRPPIRYSGLLSTKASEVKSVQEVMQHDWEVLLDLESKDLHGTYVRGLDALHCLQGCLCRLAFLLNERDCKHKTQQASIILKALITNFGDTLCVENTHQSAKDVLREARHNIKSRVCKQAAVIGSRLFQTRQAPHIAVSELELSTASCRGYPAFLPLTNPNSHQMQREYQQLMQHKSGAHWWPSTSHATQFEEAAALNLILQGHWHAKCHLNCLAGKPGTLIASSSKGLVCMVLSKTSSGVLTWAMERIPDKEPTTFKCITTDTALQFQHICSLDEWLEIPIKPILHNQHGGLVLQQSGPPLPLAVARIQSGLDLVVRGAKEALAACGVTLPGQPSKATVYKALVEQFVAGAPEVEELLALSSAKMKDEEDDDKLSDYQDLLDLIEEDCENRNDPDIRQEKQRLQNRRNARPKANKGEVLLEPPQQNAGKGRGRGRGKGKGRPKGSGSGKG